ncbi:TlpA family protein disulfide reductase [Flavobacteriaceae bacterium F89]|uniref:TlpA family protein disulfide reductase n=1 Tax=Cerina litoralis TaxID=2874477 RepID=A0AAE3ETE6_9FLAO|nr:TlpA disulfide reductase family protein [Cerina litoralis]MCG2460150.1 TlpA family protein disulfide reductase [Cerina litoralis]
MRLKVLNFFLFFAIAASAQHTISGTFSPAEDYTWLIAYRITSHSLAYTADTKVSDGKFNLEMKQNFPTGTYRLVYAVPQEECYFDIIYDGKEDIELSFSNEKGVSFIKSKENRLFEDYFKEINDLENGLTDFYSDGNTDKVEFSKLVGQISAAQSKYEIQSKGLLCHNFVIANRPYLPKNYEPVQRYVDRRKQHYFKEIDFNNPVLQKSPYLTDKVVNYVFTALPLGELSQKELETAMMANIREVDSQLKGSDAAFKTYLYYNLWQQLSTAGQNRIADFLYKNYLKQLATQTKRDDIRTKIEQESRVRMGSIPPEINWKEGGELKKLSTVTGANNYLLIFWSSTCSHCLHELPLLHKYLESHTDLSLKVIAVGLEDDEVSWKKESAKLDGFIHVISLGKWQSNYAREYGIDHTPTFFILDKEKNLVAEPEDYKGVISYLEKVQGK